jgi:hypothetical protein
MANSEFVEAMANRTCVTALQSMEILEINGTDDGWVSKKLCYRKAETLG